MNEKKELLEQDDYLDGDAFYELKESYAPWIGYYLLNFSALEHSLNTTIADLINDRGQALGYLIIERLTFSNKVDLWFKLYNQRIIDQGHNKKKTLLKKLNDIHKRIIDSNSFRNIIAHANWLSLGLDNTVRSKISYDSASGEVTFKRYKVTPEILRNKSLICMETNFDLVMFDVLPEHSE